MECLDWLTAEQAGSVLAGFTDLASKAASGKGSLALSQDQTDFFQQGRNAVLREMASCLTNYCVADLAFWNYGPGAACPTLRFAPSTDTNGTEMLQLLQAVASTPPGTATSVPEAFIDELVLKTSAYLGLNVDKVREGLTTRPGPTSPLPGAAGQVATAVDRATQLVAAQKTAATRAATAATVPVTA
jgi:hypothetical protein